MRIYLYFCTIYQSLHYVHISCIDNNYHKQPCEQLTYAETKLKVVEQKLDEERKDTRLLSQSHNELRDEHINVKEKLEDS